MKTCFVYWIHLPEHTDIFTQGYVGITTTSVEKRFQQHRYQARKGGIHLINKVVRKYEERLVVDTILISTLDYCLDVEFKLRPEPYIGWNSSVGGTHLGKTDYSTPDEVRKKISESVKKTHQERPWIAEAARQRRLGNKADETTKLKMRKAHADKSPWENSHADKTTWIRADKLFDLFCTNNVITQKHLSDLSGIPYPKLKRIFIKLKDNWNPLEDQKWLDFRDNYLKGNL